MSYTDYWMAIFVAILLSSTAARPAPLNDREAQLRLQEHYNRTLKFKCAEPQPRSYKIEDLLPKDEKNPSVSIFPLHTVIRTCDNGTGCCLSEDRSCRPVETKFEYVVVKVTNAVETGKGSSLRTLRIQHHEKCECQLNSEPSLLPPRITFKK